MKKEISLSFAERYRPRLMALYRSKYFNLFTSKYKWNGLTKEAETFLMAHLWDDGTICAFNKGGIKEENIQGVLTFAKWTLTTYDEYGYPATAKPVNQWQQKSFPNLITFGRDAVYMYAQADKKSISETVDTYLKNIVDVEVLIKVHEFNQKMPLLIKTSPENKDKLDEFMKKIFRDEVSIYVTELEANSLEVLSTGAPFLLDKLYQYKDQREAELKTFLGLDNSTKMENTIIPNADMVNANNQEINASGDVFLRPMEKFAEEISEVLHQQVSVELTQKPVTSIHDDESKEEKEDGRDDN